MIFKENACYFIMGFFCFISLNVSGQDQHIADSLIRIYHEDILQGTEKLELLRNLSFNEINDIELSLKFAEELIALSKLENNQLYLYRGYLQKGDKHEKTGDLQMALEAYFKSAEAAVNAAYISGQGSANMSIADVYSVMGNSNNAEKYYKKSIALLRKTTDSISLASALLNAGDEYFNIKNYNKALVYFEESGIIYRNINYLVGTAYNKGNIGMVYAEQGKDELAEANINEAVKILEELQDYYPISIYLTYMADIYLRRSEFDAALNYAKRSLELATLYRLKGQISEANLKLSEMYEHIGDFEESNRHLRDHITYRDSILNLESVAQMADLRTNFEVSQKQIEVDLLFQQKRNQQIIVIATIIALILIALLALGLFRRNRFIQKTHKIIQKEKDRSDKLLLNILPEETAMELKEKGKVQAKKFESVSVLFTDFKGFTKYSENLSPEELVKSVDFYYSKFDEIMEKYGLEKIKTIGDAYMAASGLPFPSSDHAYKMVLAAFDIAAFVKEAKKFDPEDQTRFDIRIGIHTGPVVAGVVGTKKFAYDIWGDTVNIASRMESNSEAGKINISESTYLLIKDSFKCTYRGEVKVKNKGIMKMYFVEGFRT